MFVTKRFLYDTVEDYGKHQVSKDGDSTQYSQAYRLLVYRNINSSYKKIIERIIQYIQDRIE